MFTRRGTIALLTAGILSVPAKARSGTIFDREVVPFSPVSGEASIHDRLNALIARLSEAGGGTVRLTPGLFPTSDSILILDNVRLIGSGMSGEDRSSIRLVDGAPPMERKAGILRLKRNDVPLDRRIVHNTAIEQLEIDGNRAHQRQDVGDAEKKYGLYAEVHDCIMRRVMVRDCMGYGFDPHGTVDLKPSKRILIEDCVARGNLKDGFTLDQQEDMVMRNCLSEGNGRAGINIVTSSLNGLFEYNSVLNNAGPGIFVQNGSHSTLLRRNRIIGNGHNGVFLRDSQAMRLTDNLIALNMHAGVRVNGGQHVSIRENLILRNLADGKTRQSEVFLDLHDGVGPDRVEVDCNHIDARRNAAVMECPDASGTRVTDNVYDSAGPNGIVLQAKDAVQERNLRLQRDRWFGAEDPLAQTGTYWVAELRGGVLSR